MRLAVLKSIFKSPLSSMAIALSAVLLPLQSCGPNRVAIDCRRIQNVTYVSAPSTSTLISEYKVDKEASIFASRQQLILAKQLAQMPLLDQALNHYRNELVMLYRHDGDLGLQTTAFMSDSGEIRVIGGSRSAYEQVAKQRIAIGQQVQNVHNHIASYCGASEF